MSEGLLTIPLTQAQQGIWLGQQLHGQSPLYNTGECLEIRGSLDVALFEQALRQVISETDALHMVYQPGEEGGIQLPLGDKEWLLHHESICADDPWSDIRLRVDRHLKTAVNLEQGPLFSQILFKAGESHYFWYQGIHHIAMDGYGYSLIARRVADVYSGLLKGQRLPRLFCSFEQLIAEEKSNLSEDKAEQDKAFWLDQLGHGPEIISLSDKPVSVSGSFIREKLLLDTALQDSLRQQCRALKANWSDLIVAAISAWVYSRTGTQEIIFGLPVMGRTGSVALRTPAMMMNIVPFPMRIQSSDSFADLVQHVRAQFRSIRPHQNYRYEQLRRDLQHKTGQSRLFGPVINIMPFDANLRFGDITAISHKLSAGPVEDLAIGISAKGDGSQLRIDLDANPDCYTTSELQTFKQELAELIRVFFSNPQQALSEVVEQPQVSVLDGSDLPDNITDALTLIRKQVLSRPDHPALEYQGKNLSYLELYEQSLQLAQQLNEKGIKAGDRVGLLLPRSIEAIVAILGISLSGAAWLPLDPHGPVSRCHTIIDDAKLAIIVSNTAFAHLIDTVEKKSFCTALLIDHLDLLQKGSTYKPAEIRPDHPAYIMYTSGSTGIPNGVAVHHGALGHFVAGAAKRYGISEDDRVLQFAPLHFDASVEELFLTLCRGATLVIRTEEMIDSVAGFISECDQLAISVLDLPTAYWHELAYGLEGSEVSLPESLQTVIIGGEAVLPERLEQWQQYAGNRISLLNTYGPTEATIVASCASLTGPAAVDFDSKALPIGEPLPGMQALVLDNLKQPVRIGSEGELFLAGGGLALGYVNREALTAERFVTLQTANGSVRAYKTGDKVRVDDNGQLVFIGRVDDEFKISGHRVNPLEIENLLINKVGIKEAAVIGTVSSNGIKRLTAWLVGDSADNKPENLRQYLLQNLPAALVPSEFIYIDRLPRNPSGKIDRKQLKQTPAKSSSADTPATDMEKTLIAVWQDVLGNIPVSPQDDFFMLGGQSLQMIQIANRLSRQLDKAISVQRLYNYPVLADIARVLEDESEEIKPDSQQLFDPVLPIKTTGDQPPLFCIHPARGVSWDYIGLSRHLPDDIPVYGIQARRLSDPDYIPPDHGADIMVDMTRDYLEQIRRIQPEGPYHLLGWSSGGPVAHNLAVELQSQGEKVSVLAILDSYPSEQWQRIPLDESKALSGMLRMVGLDPVDFPVEQMSIDDLHSLAMNSQSLLTGVSRPLMENLVEAYIDCSKLVRQFDHRRFDGDILFFTAAKPRQEHWLSREDWQPYLEGDIINHNLDCTHFDILNPVNAITVGQILSQTLKPES